MSAARQDLPTSIRPMTVDDVPAVAAIEGRAYEFPWSENIFRDCLRAGYTGVVCEQYGVLVAYGMLSCAVGEAHLLNLCIEPELQGKGLGQRILEVLIERAKAQGAARMYLEVRPSNYAAQHLYYKYGFNEVGMRKNYYRARKGREDAVVFAKQLDVE